MATKKPTTGQKYSQLLQKSDKEVEQELLGTTVEQAANTLAQGVLNVKSQALSAQSNVKKAELTFSKAEKALEAAKSANPFSVQAILDRRTEVLQAENDLETANANQKVYEETLTYLIALQTELF